MKRISLDRTIGETYKILKGQEELPKLALTKGPDAIYVYSVLGAPRSFRFSDSSVEFPIKHIGLAKLAYESAVGTYCTRKFFEGGREKIVFEPLQEGIFISNFLDDCTPDVLAWYQNKEGKPLQIDAFPNYVVHKPDMAEYEGNLTLTEHISENERIGVLYGAFSQALNLYKDNLPRSCSEEEKDEIEKEQEEVFWAKIDALNKMANDEVSFSVEQENLTLEE